MTTIEPLSRTAAAPPTPLRLTLTRPSPHTVVVGVAGELDACSAPRLCELVLARLRGTLRAVVVDLSEVDFLDAAAVSGLARASLLARHRGIAFRIIPGRNPCVTRALEIVGLPSER